MLALQDIARWCGAETKGDCSKQQLITEWAFDTRKLFRTEGVLFMALKSGRKDGHAYIPEAYDLGVRHFLVEKLPHPFQQEKACFLLVPDVLEALHQIATEYRKQLGLPVLAITGSNGKTIVKEWLFELLQHKLHTYRSPRSYNSQLGVPLSVLGIPEDCDLAVLEAGISEPGEMKRLAQIISPEMGIFTILGDAHAAAFTSEEKKLEEKLLLFESCKNIVYGADQPNVHAAMQRKFASKARLIAWSEINPDADVFFRRTSSDQQTKLIIHSKAQQREYEVILPFSDAASVHNAMTLSAALEMLGMMSEDMLLLFRHLEPVSMRMELKEGTDGNLLLLDFYNSDLKALSLALDYLNQMAGERKKTVILSEILQQKEDSEPLYQTIDQMLQQRGVSRLIGIGKAWESCAHKIVTPSRMYNNSASFLSDMDRHPFRNEAILIKGNRKAAFENIASRLQRQAHQTYLEVNLSALQHNLNVYRSFISRECKLMVMVKAMAYGSGGYRVASMLEYNQVDYLAVAYADEGVALRKEGIRTPIMVMSPVPEAFPLMIEYRLEPEIYSLPLLREYAQSVRKSGMAEALVHLEFDTGMHRLGFELEDIDEIRKLSEAYPEIKIRSVFSHLAASEDPQAGDFTKIQLEKFLKIKSGWSGLFPDQPLFHISNSSAIHRFPEAGLDMVRLGIGLYGIDPSGRLQEQLQPALRLKSYIVQIRTVPAGDGVGYGMHSKAQTERRIGVVAIGYADGYPRRLGQGKGWMQICGKKAPVVGNVCMDMCMVDLSHIPEAKEGTEAEIWGIEPSVSLVASWCETIPYELLTSVSERVKRVYLQE